VGGETEKHLSNLRKESEKIRGWLCENGDKMGKNGHAKKSNITDNESAKMAASEYGYGCAASDFFYWEDAGDKTRGECYEQDDREDCWREGLGDIQSSDGDCGAGVWEHTEYEAVESI